MAEQETLCDEHGLPASAHGLWKRFVYNGSIVHGAWLRATAEGLWVGTCTRCGDYLVPLPALQVRGRWDYEAACRSQVRITTVDGVRSVTGCGQVMTAPGGRLARHRTGGGIR